MISVDGFVEQVLRVLAVHLIQRDLYASGFFGPVSQFLFFAVERIVYDPAPSLGLQSGFVEGFVQNGFFAVGQAPHEAVVGVKNSSNVDGAALFFIESGGAGNSV